MRRTSRAGRRRPNSSAIALEDFQKDSLALSCPTTTSSSPPGRPNTRSSSPAGGFFSRLRKPDVSSLRGLRERALEAAARATPARAACRAPPRRHPNAKRVAKWVGIAAAGWILLSFLAFAVSAQLQAFKLSGEAKEALHGNPFMLASAQTILVLGTDARPPDTKEPRSGGAAPRRNASTSRPTATPPTAVLGRRIPRRHADADPGRRRLLPQTLDPARQLRRNPRPEPGKNQRRLRLRRRQAADRNRRTVPRRPDRPRRDRRLHRLRRPDRRGRRGEDQPQAQVLHRHRRRRRRRPGRLHAAARQGRTHPRRRRGAGLRAHPRAEPLPRPRQERLSPSATTTSTAPRPSRK